VTFGEVHTRMTSCDLKSSIDFTLVVRITNCEKQVSKFEITLKWQMDTSSDWTTTFV